MGLLGAGLAIASFGAKIFGASESDRKAKRAGRKQKKQLLKLFKTTKKQLSLQKEIELRSFERTGRAVKGKQRVGYAAGGVKVDTGTPLAVAIDTNAQLAMDKNVIKTRYDLEVTAAHQRAKAGMAQQKPSTLGPTALQSGITLLTSAEKSDYWGLFGGGRG